MKIRTGFVSNSSSSSFTLFGWDAGSEISDFIDMNGLVNNKKLMKSCYSADQPFKNVEEVETYIENEGDYEIYEYLQDIKEFDVENAYENDYRIGLSALLNYDKNKSEEEKIDEFVDKLKNIRQTLLNSPLLNQKFKDKVSKTDISIQSECWRDG